jgi:hypothetical protein
MIIPPQQDEVVIGPINGLRETYVKDEWYAEISEGTTGIIEAPAGATFLLDTWPEDIDAVVSTISAGERPDVEHVQDASGAIITTTFDATGAYTLSGTPSSYPIAIIFAYKVKLEDYDFSKSLNAFTVLGAH